MQHAKTSSSACFSNLKQYWISTKVQRTELENRNPTLHPRHEFLLLHTFFSCDKPILKPSIWANAAVLQIWNPAGLCVEILKWSRSLERHWNVLTGEMWSVSVGDWGWRASSSFSQSTYRRSHLVKPDMKVAHDMSTFHSVYAPLNMRARFWRTFASVRNLKKRPKTRPELITQTWLQQRSWLSCIYGWCELWVSV